jgi:hypothetical protein
MTGETVSAGFSRLRAAARDAGQGTLEYVGMIAVAATLVIAILQATKAVDLAGFFTSAIGSITGFGGGDGGGPDSGGG